MYNKFVPLTVPDGWVLDLLSICLSWINLSQKIARHMSPRKFQLSNECPRILHLVIRISWLFVFLSCLIFYSICPAPPSCPVSVCVFIFPVMFWTFGLCLKSGGMKIQKGDFLLDSLVLWWGHRLDAQSDPLRLIGGIERHGKTSVLATRINRSVVSAF